MKRQIFALIVLSLGALLVLSSCTKDEHTHSFGEWETKKTASCTAEGEKSRFCSCGEKQTDGIAALGHSYVDGVCSVCGEGKDIGGEEGDGSCAHSNKEKLNSVLPTCTEKGLTEGIVCLDCGKVIAKQAAIDALGHTEVIDPAIEPTCARRGYTEGKHCAVCKTVIVKQMKIDPLEHKYGEEEGEEGCGVCGTPLPSEGLVYGYYDDETCFVSSKGTCSDTYIVIPQYSPDGHKVIAIGDRAFENNTLITNISIPGTVEKIGISAFAGCSNLVSVDTSSVKTLGERAFYNCRALKSLVIDTDSIPAYAFYTCVSLSEVEMLENVKSVGENAFYGCTAIVNLEIGEGVENLFRSAFEGCSNMAGIILSDSVKYIGDKAFSGCKNLTEITLPDSVQTVGESVFHNCTRLTEVVIGDSVAEIGKEAFYNCSALTKVVMGKSVKEVKKGAFRGCGSLTSLYISDIVSWFGIKFEDVEANPLNYICNIYLDGEILTELVIPKEVTEIPYRAFYGCYEIVSVTFEEDSECEKIGDEAFRGCTGLLGISFPESVTSIGASAFYGCSKIQRIELPKDLKVISASTFYGCERLSEVSLPDELEIIGNSAFYNCKEIKKIEIPATVKAIEANAFYGYNVSEVYISDIAAWCAISFGNVYALPQYYSSSYSYYYGTLYYNGKPISELVIPKEVEFISSYAFMCYQNITAVTFEDESKCKIIGDYAFSSCKISSIELPCSVEEIGSSAFPALKSVYITDLTAWCGIKFGSGVFGQYSSDNVLYLNGKPIIDLVIPKEVTSISNYAFYGARSIMNISFEEGSLCESIGSYAFNYVGCVDIVIPETVKSIGWNAFLYSNIGAISFENTSGWEVAKNINDIIWTSVESSVLEEDPVGALTVTYKDYYWRLSEE